MTTQVEVLAGTLVAVAWLGGDPASTEVFDARSPGQATSLVGCPNGEIYVGGSRMTLHKISDSQEIKTFFEAFHAKGVKANKRWVAVDALSGKVKME